MAKEVVKKIKLQIAAGKATPAPPVGTVLGPAGINLGEFCTKYNEATRDKMGDILPVEISIYDDRSFDFVIKTPPAAFLIKKYAKINKGSAKGANDVVATLTKEQLKEIAEIKLPDLNAYTVEEAMKIVEGTARNMGVAVKGLNDKELQEKAEEAKEKEKEREERKEELAELEKEVFENKEQTVAENPEETTYHVRFFDLDLNGHVNNSKYLEWMYDVLDVAFLEEDIPHHINLKYVKEVHYGHDIKSRVETDGLITKHEIVTQGAVHAQARIEWKEK